jgi:hypothetical protein
MSGKKPEGIGTGWLGPHWLVEVVGLVAFGFLIAGFIKLIRK